MNQENSKPMASVPQNAVPCESDVTQNDLLYTYNREMFYSFDKEKGYSRKISYQYDANQTIIKQSWDAAEERLNAIKQKVVDGKLSPIAYYMEKNLMEIPMMAAYVGLRKWKVRRHLNPKRFVKLKPDQLKKYADVFEITVDELKNIPLNK